MHDSLICSCRKCGELFTLEYEYRETARPLYKSIEIWVTCPNCGLKTSSFVKGLVKDHNVLRNLKVDPVDEHFEELKEAVLDKEVKKTNIFRRWFNRFFSNDLRF